MKQNIMKHFAYVFIGCAVAIMSNIGLCGGYRNVNLSKMSTRVFSQVKKSIVMVKCDDSVGSGFIVKMEDGNKYFITNYHVFDGNATISARFLNGQELKLGQLEIASDKDLVRFRVNSDYSALDIFEEEPNVGENAFVYGNSDGGDVATDLIGKIVGVGPEKIEVSIPFVQGNSGSAVLNSEGKVIGVATYATLDVDPDDWTKANTRFTEPRRYALRLKNVSWKAVDFIAYCKKVQEDRRKESDEKKLRPEIDVTFSSPKIELRRKQGVYSADNYGLIAYVALNVMHKKDQFKLPIVRICCLLEEKTSGEKLFIDLLFDKVGEKWRSCPPVWSYGDENNGWRYSVENGRCVYFLEGLSYWRSSVIKSVKNRRLVFCSDGKNRRPGQLMRLKNPENLKILCYRYECWQNGVLVCAYDSKTESHLKQSKIPLDWYKKQKNMREFNMEICPKPYSYYSF